MTLLHMDGFELGDYGLRYPGMGNGTNASTRFGYGLCLSPGTSPTMKKSFTQSTTVIIGFAYLALAYMNFYIMGDTGSTEHVRLALNTDGSGAVTRAGTALTGGSFPARTFNPVGWNYFEIKATLSDTVGAVEVRLNGGTSPIVNITGADTKNGGTNTTFDTVAFGSDGRIDDWYICDDQGSVNNNFLGDVRVYTLAPSGNGNYSQFVGSDADSTNNYQLVDEQPYSTTDYVGSATSGDRDSYALTDLPANATTVFGIQEVAIVAKSDAGAQTIKQTVRVNSTDYETSAYTLAASYSEMRNLREQNPNTSAAWTASGVNGMEAGVRVG